MHLHKFDQNFTTAHIDNLTISSISSGDNKNILQNFTTAQAALAKQIMYVDIHMVELLLK